MDSWFRFYDRYLLLTLIHGCSNAPDNDNLSSGSLIRSFLIKSLASSEINDQKSSSISYLQSTIFFIISSGNSESNGKYPILIQ